MPSRRSPRADDDLPLTADEIVRRETVAATTPVPEKVAAALAIRTIVLRSDARAFDPRTAFAKVEGVNGAWRLSVPQAVHEGLVVERAERVAPNTLRRGRPDTAGAEPSRPPWQPYVYHPPGVPAAGRPAWLWRKSGAKVRPHTVYNHDDRQSFIPIGYPWHCVGRLSVSPKARGGISFGTGFLVGARTVLTAGHLIPWGQPNIMIRFVAGYFGGYSTVGPGAESWATEVLGYDTPSRMAWDIAVVRLADPLGEWLGTFGAKTYVGDWEDDPRWTLVGYPVEIHVALTGTPPVYTSTKTGGQVPARQSGISVEDDDADGSALELEHRGDATNGNSGGPLFGHWPKGPYVIGVQSGGQILNFLGAFNIEHANVAAGGNPMVDLVRWARATWG